MAVVALAMFAVLLFLGVLSIGRAPHRKARQNTPSDVSGFSEILLVDNDTQTLGPGPFSGKGVKDWR